MPRITNVGLAVISFDTSVFNQLLDSDTDADLVFAAVKHGYHFRLIGPNVEEIMATTRLERREGLFQACRRLVSQGDSDTIYPYQEILKRLIQAHALDPKAFVWQGVNMLASDFEDGLEDWELIRNQVLSTEQRDSARAANVAFNPVWENLRPKLEQVFLRNGQSPPKTFNETIVRAKNESDLIWQMGKLLYDSITKQDISPTEMQRFMDICPPFRAAIYAFLMMWYEGAVRDEQGQRIKAGRTDLFMSAHLPYCHQFITHDKQQKKCLQEIVELAGLSTVVRSYEDFCTRFLVGRAFPA